MMTKPGMVRVPVATWTAIAGLALALGCMVILFLVDPAHCRYYPQCLFHRATGWNCPGCGSLRAMHELLHGHPLAALRDNVLLMLSLPVLAVFAARQIPRVRAGLPISFPAMGPRGVLIMIGVLTVFTIVRNIPCAPFIYLSPP